MKVAEIYYEDFKVARKKRDRSISAGFARQISPVAKQKPRQGDFVEFLLISSFKLRKSKGHLVCEFRFLFSEWVDFFFWH